MTYKKYASELRGQLGYIPTWLPSQLMRVGDVGLLTSSRPFQPTTTLADLQIEMRISQGASTDRIEYSSTRHVTVSQQADTSGTAPGAAIASEINVDLSADGAVLFQARGCRPQQLTNRADIEADLRMRLRTGEWQREWFVVTEVVHVESLTVFMASSSNANLVIGCNITTSSHVDIADASLGLYVKRSSGVTLSLLAHRETTPLYKVAKLSFFGSELTDHSMAPGGSTADASLIDVGPGGLSE